MTFESVVFTKIIPHKKSLIHLSWLINFTGLCIVAVSVIITSYHFHWTKLGTTSGNLAIIFFCLTLLPGILKRFQVTGSIKTLQLLLMSFRRQLGIMMYFFVLEHYLWVRLLPTIKFSSSIIPGNIYEIMGMIAFFLLTPVFLTSNDYSVKRFGSYWKLVHKLVYVINWFILLHLLILGRGGWNLALIYCLAILEIASLVVMIHFKKSKPHSVQSTPQATVNLPIPENLPVITNDPASPL